MTDEDAMFDAWYVLWHQRNFNFVSADALGYRAVMLEAWKARASLHVTPTSGESKP